MIFRQEEKYLINNSQLNEFLKFHKARTLYRTRTINSIYFDTNDYIFFSCGEEGTVPREKIRYRWYGSKYSISNNGNLERKITLEFHREKETYATKFTNLDELNKIVNRKFHINLNPICQISYQRMYFINDEKTRFTYDFDIYYKSIFDINFKKINNNVFEIKYESKKINDKYSTNFGDQRSRFSKYNEAVLRINPRII